MSAAKTPAWCSQAVFNHVALPPRLPQKQDAHLELVEKALVDILVEASRVMRDSQLDQPYRLWDTIQRALRQSRQLNMGGRVERSQLVSHFKQMQPSDVMFLHIANQNAGIMVQKPAE